MIPRGAEDDTDISFNPVTKCCTYHPELHNFIAGNILADERPEGYAARRTLERRIADRVAVTPLAIAPPPLYQVLYNNSALAGPDVFGRAEALRCPFYLEHSGQCGIWLHREVVCSTFFCKYARGPAGRHFWRALAGFLGQLEFTVRTWALDQIDPSGSLSNASLTAEGRKQSKSIDESGLAGKLPPGAYERLWGPFVGREVELYRACAELVNKLDFGQVMELGGAISATGARTLVAMHKRLLDTDFPESLRRGANPVIQLGRGPGKIRVKSNSSPYDYIDLPIESLSAASRLLDRPLAEARAELRAAGLDLDDQALRWLIDFEVVAPA